MNRAESEEPLILVDSSDRILGYLDKDRCHDGAGILHRAFSVFVVDANGRWLLQQRSRRKRLWPLYWSNSCCSHPRRGEDTLAAAERRLHEELGLEIPLRFTYQFEYQAEFGSVGSERELCSVFLGRSSANPAVRVDPEEVAAHVWKTAEEIDSWLAQRASELTPWFLLEWPQLRARCSEWFS